MERLQGPGWHPLQQRTSVDAARPQQKTPIGEASRLVPQSDDPAQWVS